LHARMTAGLKRLPLLFALALAPVLAHAQDAPAGDAEAGRTVFNRQCQVCHATQAGQNKVGPTLAGVFGRKSAEAPGFNYSPALREANRTWDAPTLDAYLADPRGNLPGSRMIFAGLRDAKQRADVIAYLQTLR